MEVDEYNEDAMFQDAAQTLIDQSTPPVVTDPPAPGEMPVAEGDTTPPVVIDPPAPVDTIVNPTSAQPADVPPIVTPATPINFEEISKGLVKTPEDITRISAEYLNMQTELETLREQVKRDPFANEVIKTLNQMHADGKSADQVKTFMQLQDLGDISKLSPLDAMVQARVLRDGRDADLTKTMLERKYQITEGMDDVDRQIAEETMKDDAKADYEYLTSQKKELAAPKEVVQAQEAATVISQEAIRAQVAPIKEKIKANFSSLGEINLNNKVDKDGKPTADAVLFDLPIPTEFKEKIPALLESYFVDSNIQVTKENLETAMGIIQFEMFNQYGVKLIQDAVSHYGTIIEKRIRAEYQNNNPEKKDRVNQQINAMNLTDDQLDKYVSGE